MRRRYWKELECYYEYFNSDMYRLWVCLCGAVLREDNMTDLQLAYDLENND